MARNIVGSAVAVGRGAAMPSGSAPSARRAIVRGPGRRHLRKGSRWCASCI